jgi:hypothetical protein
LNHASITELKVEVLKLSPERRAELAHLLLKSLEELSKSEIEQLWVEEAIRRDRDIDNGQIELRPAKTVMQEARARLR